MTTNYDKGRERDLTYPEALTRCHAGWLISRPGWNAQNQYVFSCIEGSFTAQDRTVGPLRPGFLVIRTAQGEYVPWLCSQSDQSATDWVAITRQQVTARNADRNADDRADARTAD